MSESDKELGMDREISRRDFIQGASLALGSAWIAPGCSQKEPSSQSSVRLAGPTSVNPPARTGLRGSHDGSWEVAHALRDGEAFLPPTPTGEHFDLVVVGAGISGLSAAYFFRQQLSPEAKILILDNHDDFGGHAKRNEFTFEGRRIIGYGGTQSIEAPARYSPEAKGLLRALDIEIERFYEAFDQGFYAGLGMSAGDFFNAEVCGQDLLLARRDTPWEEYIANFPMAETDRQSLLALITGSPPELPNARSASLTELLEEISYESYLRTYMGATEAVIRYLADKPRDTWGIGADSLQARTALETGYPGFRGVELSESEKHEEEPYIFHFPDGNAAIARLLVRSLIPGIAPRLSMEDIVTAPLDYGSLDDRHNPVRLRLLSTVTEVRNLTLSSGKQGVGITYMNAEKPHSVTADSCVLACWNGVVPFLCPELPAAQREALAFCVKVPYLYVNALVRNFRPWADSELYEAYCPGSFFSDVSLDFPVSLGSYQFARGPEDPVVIHMVRAPAVPGLDPGDQFRAGRAEMLSTTFEDYEREVRKQLARMLGSTGFDPVTDIVAITVNRWPHGYAYEYAYLGDHVWRDDNKPCVVGRQPFGRIFIANSDAAGRAYTDAAIDQAYRAISELLSVSS